MYSRISLSFLNQISRNIIVEKYGIIKQNIKQLSMTEVKIRLKILMNRKAFGTDEIILECLNKRKKIKYIHNLINKIWK